MASPHSVGRIKMSGRKTDWTNPMVRAAVYQKGYARKYRAQRKDWLWAYKASLGCLICGETDPRCLDFHHRDGEHKLMCISKMSGSSLERVRGEIDKCDVLCANCHRKLHK